MKKLFSTILAVMVAVVMSFAVVAFTGCGPTTPEPEPTPTPSYTPGLATGNEVYDGIISTEFAGLTLVSTTTIDDDVVSVNAKVNLNGNADISVGFGEDDDSYYYFVRDWKIYTAEAEAGTTDFSEATLGGIIDVNQVIEAVFDYVGEASGGALPEGIANLIKLDDILEGSISGVNYAIISLADAAEAVTETDTTVTVDFNKMAYNMVNQAKAVVASLKADTTVADLLGNSTVKKYAQILTELVTPDDIVDFVAGIAETLGELGSAPATLEEDGDYDQDYSEEDVNWLPMAGAAVELVNDVLSKVQPDENSSVYDYIVKVLGSQELLDAVNGMLEDMGALAGTGLTKKITEFTLGEIIDMIPTNKGEATLTVDGLKEMIDGYITGYTSGITATELSVSLEGEEIFSLTDASLVYTYGANGLTSMKFGMKLSVTDEFEMEVDATLTLSKTAYAASEFAKLPETLPVIEDFEFGGDNVGPGPDPDHPVIGPDDGSIVGKTAQYNSLYVEGDEELTTAEEKEQLDAMIATMMTNLEDMRFTFNDDGTSDFGGGCVYKQEGTVITCAENEESMNNGEMVVELHFDGGYLLWNLPSELTQLEGINLTIVFDIIN